jgi:hypothetical protein
MILWNKYILIGIGLIIIGIPLSALIIGIPIMIAGFLIGDFGVALSIIRVIPGLEKKIKGLWQMIIDSYKPYFRKGAKEK